MVKRGEKIVKGLFSGIPGDHRQKEKIPGAGEN
jgi:hypothetical protein